MNTDKLTIVTTLASILSTASTRINSAYSLAGEVRAALREGGHLSTETFGGGAKAQSFGEVFPDVDNNRAARELLRKRGTPVNDETVSSLSTLIRDAKQRFTALGAMAKAFGLSASDIHELAKLVSSQTEGAEDEGATDALDSDGKPQRMTGESRKDFRAREAAWKAAQVSEQAA